LDYSAPSHEVPGRLRPARPLRQDRHQYNARNAAAADIKAVLGTVSASVSDDDLNRVLASLKGKPIHELISNGIKKLGGSGAAPAAKGKDAGKDAGKKDEKKDEKKEAAKPAPKKEEPKPAEEEDMGLGGGLFDF
jgi:ribosomal protein L12E/L44/L45/RPP1/RPP2